MYTAYRACARGCGLAQWCPTLGGYYTTLQVVILLAYMALCRIKTVEQLQYESPGELGKLLGLDHAPEKWAGLLSKQWLEDDPVLAGTLYVDGHVRLYHGKQTELPKRYVSRQRLCLRGTTDYWVNDALGKPFFRVERPIDQGMLEALRSDIVPQLLRDVPRQPSPEELQANPHRLHHLPQIPERGLAGRGIRGDSSDSASRRDRVHEAG